jgi:LmbE family N-acetylglucosaminyl deacetylase
MKRSIFVVGAHADDIEIQLGGTLLKYRDQGYSVVYVMSTNNMSGQVSELLPDGKVRTQQESVVAMMPRRKRECDVAATALGTTPIHLDHPQRHYTTESLGKAELRYRGDAPPASVVPDNVPSILTAQEDAASVDKLADLIVEHDAEAVFTHGVAQLNVEHFTSCLLVTNAYWKAVERGYRGGLLHWREHHTNLGEFNCRWETYVDYTPYLDRKMALIGLHRCQMPKAHLPTFGHRVLATQWGAACGVGAAECFTWVRRPDLRDQRDPLFPPLSLELLTHSR